MRQERQELILGGICGNQLLTQCDVACFVFHQIKHALDGFLCALQPEKINVQKMRHTGLVFQRVLSQLKRGSKGKHSVNRAQRRNLHIIGWDF